jgi:hypothetical protein
MAFNFYRTVVTSLGNITCPDIALPSEKKNAFFRLNGPLRTVGTLSAVCWDVS